MISTISFGVQYVQQGFDKLHQYFCPCSFLVKSFNDYDQTPQNIQIVSVAQLEVMTIVIWVHMQNISQAYSSHLTSCTHPLPLSLPLMLH